MSGRARALPSPPPRQPLPQSSRKRWAQATCHAAREGKLSLSLNVEKGGRLPHPEYPKGELLIGPPRRAAAAGDDEEESGQNLQFIMSLDMAHYKQLLQREGYQNLMKECDASPPPPPSPPSVAPFGGPTTGLSEGCVRRRQRFEESR
eukprot:COSAG04_NODE_863_length_9800_cov_12.998248_10_plen_148_part_00